LLDNPAAPALDTTADPPLNPAEPVLDTTAHPLLDNPADPILDTTANPLLDTKADPPLDNSADLILDTFFFFLLTALGPTKFTIMTKVISLSQYFFLIRYYY
jgi:hypothetical protein